MQGMVRAVLGLRDFSLDVPAAQTSLVALLQLMLQVSCARVPSCHVPALPCLETLAGYARRLCAQAILTSAGCGGWAGVCARGLARTACAGVCWDLRLAGKTHYG